jgi:hypothetical protein
MRDLGRNLMPKVLNTKYLPGRITAALCESLGILSDDERINVGQELFSRAEQLESLVRDFRSGLGKYDVLKASGFEG